jgi:hypothetical protein
MHADDGSATQLFQGAVSDRPWGLTLGALGTARRTVQLTLRADERVFRIELDRGVVIAASSPVAADSVARVALAIGLIEPAQVDAVKRRLAQAPHEDEVGALASVARLSPEQARALRCKLITQRAARTFSVERGAYALEERVPRPAAQSGGGVDIRPVVYAGARVHLSELRLAVELGQLGDRFALKPDAIEQLPRYGFTLVERPVLEALRRGTSLAELEANQRELDPRVARAVLYALASCDALMPAERLANGSGAMRPIVGRTPTPQSVPPVQAMPPVPQAATPPRAPVLPTRAATAMGVQSPRPPAPVQVPAASVRPAASAQPLPPPASEARLQPRTSPPRARPRTLAPRPKPRTVPPRVNPRAVPLRAKPRTVPPPQAAEPRPRSSAVPPPAPPRPPLAPPRQRPGDTDADFTPQPRSMLDTFRTNRITAVRPNALAAHEVTVLIEERTALLDRGADHFTLLGLAIGASIEDVHAAYVELSRNLRPARLDELGIFDESFAAQRLLAQIGIAFTVLTDRVLRPEYMASLVAAPHRPAAVPP